MSDRVTNRYFGKAPLPKLPINFKEFSLAVAPTTVYASSRAMWNGGDGYEWVIVRPKIRNVFVSRSLQGFLDGTELPNYDLNPPTEQQFVDQFVNAITDQIILTRNASYAALCTRFNLPVIGWGAVANVNALNPVNQDLFHAARFNIEMDYQKSLSQIVVHRNNKAKEYRDMIEQNDKRRERFRERQKECNKTFREVFGPVAMSYIELLVNGNQFEQAWNVIHHEYNTAPANMLRSGIIRKLNLIQYDMETHTIGSLIQSIEETWEPLILNGGFSDDEKIDTLKNAFRNHDGLFREIFDHCRRNEHTYAQTRDLLIREMTLKMTEMAKEHNMIEHVKRNYSGYSKPEKMYSTEHVETEEEGGEMAKVKANITCYNCGKKGHYSSQCRSERKVTKRYIPTMGDTSRSYSVETRSGRHQNGRNYEGSSAKSGYESTGSQGSRMSRSSRDSKRSASSKESRGSTSFSAKSSMRNRSPHPRFNSTTSTGSKSSTRSTNSQRGRDRVKEFRNKIFQRIKNKAQRSDDDDEEFGCIENVIEKQVNYEKTKLLKFEIKRWNELKFGKILSSKLSASGWGETPQTEGRSGNRDDQEKPLTDEIWVFILGRNVYPIV